MKLLITQMQLEHRLSAIKLGHKNRQWNCWSLRCSWSIPCRRCSNYIFILDLTPGFNGLDKDNCKTGWETFKFWDSVHLVLEVWQYVSMKHLVQCPTDIMKLDLSVLTLLILKTKYCQIPRSMPWLLMPWLLAPPVHQPPWYWQCRINRSLQWERISHTCTISKSRNDRKCKYIFMSPKINSAWLTEINPWTAGNSWVHIQHCGYRCPGARLNIKTVLSTYGDFHVKDKTAVRTSYL